MDGTMTPSQAGSFLMGLRMKGESPLEMAHATLAPRWPGPCAWTASKAPIFEVVGTGGDGRSSLRTAPHRHGAHAGGHGLSGGQARQPRRVLQMRQRRRAGRARRQSGRSNPAEVGKILHDQNFVFLFAQRFHPCFRNIAPTRDQPGILYPCSTCSAP